MISRKKLSLVFLGILFLSLLMVAQFDDDKEVAQFAIFKSYDRIHPGMELRIAVKVTIKVFWHINSNHPSQDYMIGTKVTIPQEEPFELKDVVYPEPSEIRFGFSESALSVYQGVIFIFGIIPVPADLGLGKHTIPFHINYQACNDATCLPPQMIKKQISVVVVDVQTPIEKVNADIFEKLGKKNTSMTKPKIFSQLN